MRPTLCVPCSDTELYEAQPVGFLSPVAWVDKALGDAVDALMTNDAVQAEG